MKPFGLKSNVMIPLFRSLEPNLRDTLVSILSAEAPMSARTMHSYAARMYRPVSVQAMYKELRKLEALGIVVRSREGYALHLAWTLEVADWHEKLLRTYSSERYLR